MMNNLPNNIPLFKNDFLIISPRSMLTTAVKEILCLPNSGQHLSAAFEAQKLSLEKGMNSSSWDEIQAMT